MHLEKGGEGTQISQDPPKTVPEKPGQQSTKKGGGTQRRRDPSKTKAVPERPGQKSTV